MCKTLIERCRSRFEIVLLLPESMGQSGGDAVGLTRSVIADAQFLAEANTIGGTQMLDERQHIFESWCGRASLSRRHRTCVRNAQT
jgi:hypothetical protein